MPKHWIKGAIKNPGALRKEMGVKKGEKIPAKKEEKKISSLRKKAAGDKKLDKSQSTMLKRLLLARTLSKMRGRKKKSMME